MPCVHWEFSLGAFLCTCAEHNKSPFLQGGIADSQRKNGLAWSRTCSYLITECGPEGLSIVIPSPHPLLSPLSCCWVFFVLQIKIKVEHREAGMGEEGRKKSTFAQTSCWEIKAQILQEMRIWLTWKSVAVRAAALSVLLFAVGVQENYIFCLHF